MPTRCEAIKNFLRVKARPELADLYGPHMEVQVNVFPGNGEKVGGEFQGHTWTGWSDGLQTWKQIRIPFNAKTKPEYSDSEIKFDLAAHAEAIGMTGWDWVNKRSRWVGFDFDAIAGHKESHTAKLTDQQLNEVREAACNIPWVTVRQSTSGNGLHLYVFVNVNDVANHTEHQALGRSILGKMSAITGFDFNAKVDNCGGILWVWATKFDVAGGMGGPGLKLIKQGEELKDIPTNWRDHVKVTTGKRKRLVPEYIEEAGNVDEFLELCGQRPRTTIDEDHKKLMSWLEVEGEKDSWWDADNHMLVCHTLDLQAAHAALGLRGMFKTKSSGSSSQNCFCYPMRKGAWSVRRHTAGVQEDESWDQDGSGWTRCYLNRDLDFKSAAKSHGGVENEKGAFVFRESETAMEAIKALGAPIDIPNYALGRQAIIRPHKDGRRVIFELVKANTDSPEKFRDWIDSKGVWQKIMMIQAAPESESEVGSYEHLIRHIVTESNKDAGWVLKSEEGWGDEKLEHIKYVLHSLGVGANESKSVLGNGVMQRWTLVNRPFQPEYPGGRTWNRNSTQFAFPPSLELDNLRFDDWTRILKHCGSGLDVAIKTHPWCKMRGIHDGGDYLKLWIAYMFQRPLEQLPYLFFFGPEDSGKSIIHEAIELLVTKGVQRADVALTSQQGFNGELEGAILCVVEETDLRTAKGMARNRIKDWVTSKNVPIHHKNGTPYTQPNSWHWIQDANFPEFCPIFVGDTRITMGFVRALTREEMIPKSDLLARLRKQGPDFLASILSMDLPDPTGRLNIPVITTEDKIQSQTANRSVLEEFIAECTYAVEGAMVKQNHLFDKFVEWLPANMVQEWSPIRFGREIVKLGYVKGRNMKDGAQHYVGNISLTDKPSERSRIVLEGEKLV